MRLPVSSVFTGVEMMLTLSSPLIPPLSVPPPPQGSFPSTLESSRATRHHGLVERVQRDRRFVSPVRPYRKVSFSLREAPCLIPDCSCAPDFLSVCLLPVKTVKPLSCTLIAGNYFQQRMTKNLQQQLQDGVWNKSVCVLVVTEDGVSADSERLEILAWQ